MPSIPDLGAIAASTTAAITEHAHRKENPAGHLFARLTQHIARFQRSLSDDYDPAVFVGANGPAFYVRDVQFSDPDMLIFRGIDGEGHPIELLQHHSQPCC